MEAGTRPAVGALLERERELARLDRAIAGAVEGVGSVVALEGVPGIGKTALLAHAHDAARDAGMRVLSARGGELERDFAYGVVRQLLDAPLASARPSDRERWLAGAAGLAAPVVMASAVIHPTGPDPGPILHGLYWLTANLSTEQPLLIAVDDAHWADPASIAFMSYLARRVDELAVVMLYAYRVDANHELSTGAELANAATVLRPRDLSEGATQQFVERSLGCPSSRDFAHACHIATGGNPFMLSALLHALDADAITPDDASAGRVQQIAPTSIAQTTIARLRRVGVAATEIAFAVAVLGTRAELRHAARLAGLSNDSAAQAADDLTAAAILRDRRPLEFIHPIVRAAIYDALAPGQRAALHKRAALLLAEDARDDVALAPHLLATEPSGDPWVVERLCVAAQEVLDRGAPGAACMYLERAIREPAATSSDRLSLLLALGTAELADGAPAAGIHLREVVDGACDPETRVEAVQKLMCALSYAGRAEEAAAIATKILSDLPPEDHELRLRLEAELAGIAQFAPSASRTNVESARGCAFTMAALEPLVRYEGQLHGDTTAERRALAYLAFFAARRGRSHTAAATAELARLALTGDDRLQHDKPGLPPFFFATWALALADELDDAERHLELAIGQAQARGSAAAFGLASGLRCQVLLRQGRLIEAEAESLSLLDAFKSHAIVGPLLLSCLLHTMVERSDLATAGSLLVDHGIEGDLSDSAMAGPLLFSRGHLLLAARDARAALRDFEQLRHYDEVAGREVLGRPTHASQALALFRLGQHDAARALSSEALEHARLWDTPSAHSFALRTAAIISGGDDAIELLREAVAAVERSPARYECAQSLTHLGAALRRGGLRHDAREPLRRGLDLATRCGALRLANTAREELIATGARPRRTALSGRDALTPCERRVAQLAAGGLTNREIAQSLFVTSRTIEAHLTQTYLKLAITSREQLTTALRSPDQADE